MALPVTSLAWLMLTAAGLLEVVWALSLKYTQGFTRLGPSVFTLAAMGLSFYLLSRAVMHLPVGTAYAVWVGIGAAGAATFGMLFLHETVSVARLGCLALLIVAIVGLKLTSSH